MLVHLNGQILPLAEARISPLDRGFVFGDGVYEGLRAIPDDHAHGGPDRGDVRIIGLAAHLRRMQAGLDSARIPFDAASLGPASIALLRAADLRDAFVYWQVTRGTPALTDPPRSRVPPPNMRPTVFGYAAPQPAFASISQPPTKRASLCRDIRWELGRLKSISLMGNIVTAIEADSRGGEEAIMVRASSPDCTLADGLVSEGLATNVVLAFDDHIVTPGLDSAPMLEGVTRAILLRAVPEIRERPVHARELPAAREIMLVGTTTYLTAITHLDGRPIGGGAPGPVAKRLFNALLTAIRDRRDEF